MANITKTALVCVRNDGYEASLIVRKIYEGLADDDALRHQLWRVVDESGEDYLYPAEFFVPIDLSDSLAKALNLAA